MGKFITSVQCLCDRCIAGKTGYFANSTLTNCHYFRRNIEKILIQRSSPLNVYNQIHDISVQIALLSLS